MSMCARPHPTTSHDAARAVVLALAALILLAAPARAQDSAAGAPSATQSANVATALDLLRADIAEATAANAETGSAAKKAANAAEIAVYQRVLDNLTGKLAGGELHPIDGLSSGMVPGTDELVRFVYEDDKARTTGMESTPTGAYCPDGAYVLIGTRAALAAYQNIKGKDAAAARAARTAFVATGRVRRIACPRGHMIFDSGLLDPGAGQPLDDAVAEGWCEARELLDVLAHEKFHEIVIEDEVEKLRLRPDFINSNPADRARREAAVFRQGASHSNHKVVYTWQIKVNELALKMIERRAKEIRDGEGEPAGAGEAAALEEKEDCLKRRITELKRYGRRATGGTRFHSAAVREHQECVGTTYHVSETVIEQGETLVSIESQIITEQDNGLVTDDGGIAECSESGGSAITYISIAPQERVPPSSPPGDEAPPASTVAEDDPESTSVPEEDLDLDLGLVKAVTSVVTVALSRQGGDEPIEGATVKLLEEVPELPDPVLGGAKLASMHEYLRDQAASMTGTDGVMRLEVSPEIDVMLVDDDADTTGSTVLDVGDKDAGSDGKIRVHHRIEAKTPLAQAVTAMPTSAATPAGRMPYPIALGQQWREKICTKRSFIVGDTSVFVLRLPEEAVKPFVELVSQTESVLFVEDDPCREKETFHTPPGSPSFVRRSGRE